MSLYANKGSTAKFQMLYAKGDSGPQERGFEMTGGLDVLYLYIRSDGCVIGGEAAAT
jgi:hypothetical protein